MLEDCRMSEITWGKEVEVKFKQMLEKIPTVLRPIAQEKVGKRAEKFAQEAGRLKITERDMVDAFFAETPGGFHGPMKVDMESLGIDYTKYGYERDEWKKMFGIK